MNQQQLALMIPMVVCTGMFAMIFGIFYLNNRERMAMIERGMDPRTNNANKIVNRSYVLTWGLLLIGAGLGLFLAYILDSTLPFARENSDNPAIYFSLIGVFGGLGLFTSYLIEKKENRAERLKHED